MIKTAMTIAAFDGRDSIWSEDLKEAAGYVLPHRMRKKPFEDSKMNMEFLDEKVNEIVSRQYIR
jgi:magnesium chelatase subunit I